MIEAISGFPDHVLGFEANGTVTKEDYQTAIVPAVEAAFERHPKVRFLYHLGDDFSGFEMGAAWEDSKIGLKHLRGWERIAVVSDTPWVRAGVKIFSFLIPGEIRVFHNAEIDEAKTWIVA